MLVKDCPCCLRKYVKGIIRTWKLVCLVVLVILLCPPHNVTPALPGWGFRKTIILNYNLAREKIGIGGCDEKIADLKKTFILPQ